MAPRPLGEDEHGGPALNFCHCVFDGLQCFPRVVPVDIDVACLLYGPAEDRYAEKLPFCDELERDRQAGEEDGNVEGALVVRHEKIGGPRDMLCAFNGNGDACRPELGPRPYGCDPVHPLASRVEGRDCEGNAGEEQGGAYQVQIREDPPHLASFSRAVMISSTSVLIVGSIS